MVGPADARRPFNWSAVVAPMGLGVAVAMVTEPVAAVFGLLGPVMAAAGWWEERHRHRRSVRGAEQAFEGVLAEFVHTVEAARRATVAEIESRCPPVSECAARAFRRDERLWVRRPGDADFLQLRLGRSEAAWRPDVAGPASDPRVAAALEAGSGGGYVPVVIEGKGAVLGLVGPRNRQLAVARSLLVQVAVHHSPVDLDVVVLSRDEAAWDWVKWLPHSRRPGRAAVVEGGDWHDEADTAFTFVVCDGPAPGSGAEAARCELVLVPSGSRLVAGCSDVVDLDGWFVDGAAGRVAGLRPEVLGESEARRAARALAPLRDVEAGPGGALPDRVRLRALPGAAGDDPAVLRARWRAGGDRPAAAIGTGRDGPLSIDLVADGPHGLVAGTTGSGKSELLRTLVASLALAVSPERLNFVLIDYKGGAAFDACSRLPHTVGVVTDLDGHLAARALRCLEAELRHREAVLRSAGASNLDELSEPEPARLVILVDEFATLAADIPEFVSALVDIAQRGRSLGVHLLMATQRPSGIIGEAMRANLNLRIALRVQDEADSRDVLGAGDAARIPPGRPGRGLLRRGPGEPEAFQGAWVSGRGSEAGLEILPFTGAGRGPEPSIESGPTDLERVVAAACRAAAGMGPARTPWPDPLPMVVPPGRVAADGLGLADDPDRQLVEDFTWTPAAGNVIVLGVAGSGTTTALVRFGLALTGSVGPGRRHLFLVDQDTSGLAILDGLPHVAGWAGPGDDEECGRLLARLIDRLEARSRDPQPGAELVLLLDNLGGLLSRLDDVGSLDERTALERLLADGPGVGISVVASARSPADVPGVMSAGFPVKLLLRLGDRFEYAGLIPIPERVPAVPGRGYDARDGREIQFAGVPDPAAEVSARAERWGGEGGPARPAALPARVPVAALAPARLDGAALKLPCGVFGGTLEPAGLVLYPGEGAIVTGPAGSGRSGLLAALLGSFVRAGWSGVAVAGPRSPLRRDDGWRVIGGPEELDGAVRQLGSGPVLVVVDDADGVEDPGGVLIGLSEGTRPRVHLVAACGEAPPPYGHWLRVVARSRCGVVLGSSGSAAADLWQIPVPRSRPGPPGRGFLVEAGRIERIQAAG